MDSMESIVLKQKIHSYCLARANDENVLKYSRYFKDGLYDGYGLSAPQIYEGVKELLQNHNPTLSSAMEAAPDILKYGKYEEISMLMLVIKGLHKQFSRETFKKIALWYQYSINNWAHADTLGMMVLPIFLNKKLVAIEDFNSWLVAENKFQRRSVPVTLIKLLKTHKDFPALFRFIECLITDPEREVHQGTGWFLREAWKKNPAETEMFLLKWKDKAPRLIIQYATEKMTKEARVRFKKTMK